MLITFSDVLSWEQLEEHIEHHNKLLWVICNTVCAVMLASTVHVSASVLWDKLEKIVIYRDL